MAESETPQEEPFAVPKDISLPDYTRAEVERRIAEQDAQRRQAEQDPAPSSDEV